MIKQNNENEKCAFSQPYLEKNRNLILFMETTLIWFFLMVSQNLSTKYLEMMPQPITASEYQQPFHYCWWTAILSRNRMHESVYLSITSKDLQNYFGLYRGQRRNTNPNFKIELEKQTSKGRKRESNHSLSLGNMNYLSSANELNQEVLRQESWTKKVLKVNKQ